MRDFDVVVIGGGHAGCEAAAASARCGADTALVTNRFSTIGEMSCNPAIGGLGKGHLVREIDALDGLMARAADAAAIQFRVLNRSKGPAVQGPRVQADRGLYRHAMQALIGATSSLAVVEGEAARILLEHGVVQGVELADGRAFRCRAIVLTTGTFLRGVIHLGDSATPAGRFGEKASVRLAEKSRRRWLHVGPTEDRDSAPDRCKNHRLGGARSAGRRQSHTVPFLVHEHRGCAPIALLHHPDDPGNPPGRSREPVSVRSSLRRDLRPRPEVLPLNRGQGCAFRRPGEPSTLPRA